jgi:hypothetical protein
VTSVMWNLVSVHLEIVFVSVQDRCTVYVIHTMGSEIIFDTPSSTSGDEDQVELDLVSLEIGLILTQDRCTICDEHTIGSENILDTPNGTPR